MQNSVSIRLRPWTRLRWRWVLACAGLLHGCAGPPPVRTPPLAAPPPPAPPGPQLLAPGERVERSLGPGGTDTFRVAADAGGFLALEAEARAPVSVRLLAPGGTELARGTTRTGAASPLHLALLVPEGGEHRVEVTASNAAGEVPYRLAVREVRPTQPGDRERVQAEADLVEAERLLRLEDEASVKLSLAQATRAHQLFETAGDAEGRVRALLLLAALRLRLDAPAEATTLARQALQEADRQGDRRAQARSLTRLGEAALAAGDPASARSSLERALPLWQGLEAPAAPEALAGRGRTLYLLGRSAGAERSLALLRESLGPLHDSGDTEGEALARAAQQPLLAGRGSAGADDDALPSLNDALALARSGGHRAVEARILAQRAPLLRQAGDLTGSQADYRRTAELNRTLGLPRAGLDATYGLCSLLRDRGEEDGARLCWTEVAAAAPPLGDREREAVALIELAEGDLRQGNPKEALTLLDRAAAPLRSLPEARRRELSVRTTQDAGIAKRNAGRPQEGLADLQAALGLLGPEAGASERARLLLQIGATQQRLGDFAAAEAAYNQAGALAAAAGLAGERRFSLFGTASVAFARKDLEGSRSALEGALALDAGTAPLAPWERTLLPGESGRHSFYELYVELLMRRHFQEPAVGFAERAFLATLGSRGVPNAELPGALARLQGGLGEGQALLHYFVGQERSYLFVVTRGGFRPFEVPIRARELALRVQRLRAALAAPQATPRPLLMEAVPLAEVLLGPARPSLEPARHWTVSAEGPLLTLPFEVLPADAKETKGRGFADLPYLLRERTLSYRPLPDPAAPATDPPAGTGRKTFLAFAAPLPRGSAPPSPRYREEVEEIAGRYPRESVAVILGEEATERRALEDPEVGTARRLHFAAQALFDSSRPLRSGIALTPEGGDDDGLLDAEEAARLHLAAELVVLPLCRTVRGREVGGEGGFALARAFLGAGARRVLLNLWPVPDAAASSLIPRLYQLLDAGESPAEALRAAKLSLLQSGSADPISWAPYILVEGRSQP